MSSIPVKNFMKEIVKFYVMNTEYLPEKKFFKIKIYPIEDLSVGLLLGYDKIFKNTEEILKNSEVSIYTV